MNSNINLKVGLGLLTAALGLALHPGKAEAAVVNHTFFANAVNYCQAFTPGITNTIRNRVIGAENVGSDEIAVACNFHSMSNGAASTTPPTVLEMWFGNNNPAFNISITCTLLAGAYGFVQYSQAKTVIVPPGARRVLTWGPADNPTPGATSLGNRLIGVNCTLPNRGFMADTYLNWTEDNGI